MRPLRTVSQSCMSEPVYHVPVMAEEVISALAPVPGGVYADGTLGGGGHSALILEAMKDTGALYGIDRDEEAIRFASERLKGYRSFHPVHGNFHDVLTLLPGGLRLKGGLIDLGVSSHQLDEPERGFSYHEDAPLDMRMDRGAGITAAEYLNGVSEEEFARALRNYADEKWAARIAAVLAEKRKAHPIKTTSDLVAVVDAAIPKAVRMREPGHSARRTFQAVRIAVNDEIAPLEQALKDWVSLLAPGGRLLVLTFHSIEDRIVKNTFRSLQNPCICPPRAPICTCGRKSAGRVLYGGAVKPGESEVSSNPRARSALLRVFEKAGEPE